MSEEWRPIETAPTDGTVVDLWVFHSETEKGERFPDMRYRGGSAGEANDWEDVNGMFSLGGDCLVHMEEISHWRPLPEGPTE